MAKIQQESSVVNPVGSKLTSGDPLHFPSTQPQTSNKRLVEDPSPYSERQIAACEKPLVTRLMNKRTLVTIIRPVPCHTCDGCHEFECREAAKNLLAQFDGQRLFKLDVAELDREKKVSDLRRWGYAGTPIPMPNGRRLILTDAPVGEEITEDRTETVHALFLSRAWDGRRAKPFGKPRSMPDAEPEWVLVTHDKVDQDDVEAEADSCGMPRDSSGRLIFLPLAHPTMQRFLEWCGFDLTRRCREVLAGVQVGSRVA